MRPFRDKKEVPLEDDRPTAAPTEEPGILSTARVLSMREPPRRFGKLGIKGSLPVPTGRASANGMETAAKRMGVALSSFGPLALRRVSRSGLSLCWPRFLLS